MDRITQQEWEMWEILSRKDGTPKYFGFCESNPQFAMHGDSYHNSIENKVYVYMRGNWIVVSDNPTLVPGVWHGQKTK